MSFLTGEIKETSSVSTEDINYIFHSLYKDYYDGVDEAYFLNNFRARDYALIFSTASGEIKGFSLQEIIPTEVEGKKVLVLWAGDILIHPDYWGKNDYRIKLAAFCLKIHEENPDKLVYRLTTPKGHKTYMIVPKLFHRFYPSPEHNYYPDFEGKVIDNILLYKYTPEVYNKEKKILIPEEDAHRLATGFAQINDALLENPYIKCFYERNPDYQRGNEIPVISQITSENLKEQRRRRAASR